MKTTLLIFFVGCSFFSIKAQSIQSENLNCEQKCTLNQDKEEVKDCKVINSKKVSVKNKKHLIKKMVSNFQGVEYKNAWELISMN